MGHKTSKLKPDDQSQREDVGCASSPPTKRSKVAAEAVAVALDLTDDWLLEIIDISHDLLRKLFSCNFIDKNQFELIRSQPLPTDKIRQLLKEVQKMTPTKQQQFFTALNDDEQSHVSNYIRRKGQRPPEDDDDYYNWPIAVCCEWSDIDKNWTELVDTIDSGERLLDNILEAKCITGGQEQTIFNQKLKFKRNETLLDTIRLRSVRDFNEFFECLRKFGYSRHVDKQATASTSRRPITTLKLNDERLLEIIDIHHGLLRELRSCHVLNQRQVELIESKEIPSEMVRQLLNEINGMENEKQCMFLSALIKLQQSHVANYLRKNGERPSTNVDDWPVAVCSQWTTVEENWATLVETIEVDDRYCYQLKNWKCVSGRQEQTLHSLPLLTESKKNYFYSDILKRGSVRNYNNFLKFLASARHYRLVALLAPGTARNMELSQEQLNGMLQVNQSALIQLIDSKNTSLLDDLVTTQSISWQDCEKIRKINGRVEANTLLLEALYQYSSNVDLFRFVTFLELTGQIEAAHVLTSGYGIVATPVARTSASFADEEMLVENFMKLLKETCPKFRQELCTRVNRVCAGFDADRANEVFAVQATSSVKFFILCKSWLSFSYLHELYSSGQLKAIFQQIFALVMENEQPVKVHTLVWDMSDYTRCAYHLSMKEGLKIYPKVYELAQQSLDDCEEFADHEINAMSFDLFPHEIVELLLLKAAGHLFAVFSKEIVRADIYILAVLCAVSRYWWVSLLDSKSIKTLLIRHFEEVCHPYRLKPKVVSTLSLPSKSISEPICMAEFNDQLFVASRSTNQVIDVACSEDIILPIKFFVEDMVVCTSTGCLFIISYHTRGIWRINLSYRKKVSQWIVTEYSPGKLSLHFDRLLVIPTDAKAIFLYNKDTQELHKRVRRPSSIFAIHHAVETANETIIVSYYSMFHRVSLSELSGEGVIMRSYEGTASIAQSTYSTLRLTVAVNEDILVFDSENQAVIVLSSELKVKNFIPTNLRVAGASVNSLYYSRQTDKLYMGYNSEKFHIRIEVCMLTK